MPALTPRAVRLLSLSAVLLVLFAVSLWLVQTGRLAGVDGEVEATIRSHGGRVADICASVIAATAGIGGAALWVAALLGAAAFQPRIRAVVVVLLALLAVTQIAELVLKALLDHPGPPSIGRTVFDLGGGGPHTQGSFPSGHMIRAVVLGAGTAMLLRRRTGPVIAGLYIVAIAATRVYLSEHWVSDVIGGLLLGLAALPAVELAR